MGPRDVIVMIKWNHLKISNYTYLLVICSKNCKDWWKINAVILDESWSGFFRTYLYVQLL